jgi:two-component system, cell cycle response regulator
MPENRQNIGDKTIQISKSMVAEKMRQETQKRACFVIIDGIEAGRIIPLDPVKITLGRDPECSVVLGDDSISRFHAEVELQGPENAVIRDLESTNGTFVGGERIRETRLSKGDKVLLGRRTILKFELYDQIEETYQKQIYESSTRDGLTGVYNRKYFNQKIISDLSFARRHKLWFTLIIFDLDHFKKINDTFGHKTGDEVLKNITASVQSLIRSEDVIARYGGEEFAVIAPGTNYEGGCTLGQRIRKKVENETVTAADGSGKSINVTVSVGFATLTPGILMEPADLIAAADKCLYEAKRGGRNCVIGSLIESLKRG